MAKLGYISTPNIPGSSSPALSVPSRAVCLPLSVPTAHSICFCFLVLMQIVFHLGTLLKIPSVLWPLKSLFCKCCLTVRLSFSLLFTQMPFSRYHCFLYVGRSSHVNQMVIPSHFHPLCLTPTYRPLHLISLHSYVNKHSHI